jgi:hypothetical protein
LKKAAENLNAEDKTAPNLFRFGWGWAVVYLLAITLICYFPALSPGRTFLPADLSLLIPPWSNHAREMFPDWHGVTRPVWDPLFQFYPARKFLAQAINSGFVPWHDPSKFSGTPFVADGQSAFFYPINWLFSVLPLDSAFGIVAALHTFLAGLFFVMFMQRRGVGWEGSLVGATTWMLCGTMVSWQMWQVVDSTLCWLPLSLYFADRLCRTINANGNPRKDSCVPKNFAGLSATIGMMLLAGHMQFAIYSILIVSAYCLTVGDEKLPVRSGLLACSLGLGTLLGSVQILPQLELIHNSLRGSDSVSDLLATSMPINHLGLLFMPEILGGYKDWLNHGYIGSVNYWEITSYIGVGSFVLAVIAFIKPTAEQKRELILWSAVALIGLLIGLGTPLVNLLYLVLPALKAFHGLVRTIIMLEFAVAVLASYGVQKVIDNFDNKESISLCGKISFGSAILVVMLYGIIASRTSATVAYTLTHEWLGYGLSQLSRALVIIAITWIAVAPLSKNLKWLIVIIVATDMLTFASGISPGSDSKTLYPKLSILDSIHRTAGSGRVLCLGGQRPMDRMIPNTAESIGLRDVSGSDPLLLKNYDQFIQNLNQSQTGSLEPDGAGIISKFSHVGLDYLNVTAVLSPQPLANNTLSPVSLGPDIYIYSNPSAHGEAWFEDNSSQSGLDSIISGNPAVNLSTSDYIESGSIHSEYITAQVVSSKNQTLVFSEISDPNWKAKVDGIPTRWHEANGLFVAMPINTGTHTVELQYLTDSGYFGLYLTCAGWMIVFGILGYQAGLKRVRQ